jgi:hypothetical protein
MSLTMTQSDTEEVAHAEAEVALHKAELARSLRAVGQSSEVMARRIGSELKPAAVAAAVVAGAVAIVGVGLLVARRRRHQSWLLPEQPSALATAAKTAGLWALRVLARRAAQEIVSRIGEPSGPLVAPAPNQVQG